MEALFDLLLWSMAGTLMLAPLGASFGALARVVAQRHANTPDATPRQAAWRGAVSGSIFLGVLGFLAGALIGHYERSFDRGIAGLAMIGGGVLSLMIVTLVFAGLAHFFVWLGSRGTGLLLTLVIVLAFGVIQARKAGFGREVVALTAGSLGLAGLALMVVLRVRSPQGENVFSPWADDADATDE